MIKKIGQYSNGYGIYKDIDENIYYIAPEAEKANKSEWKSFECQTITYIYIEEMYG